MELPSPLSAAIWDGLPLALELVAAWLHVLPLSGVFSRLTSPVASPESPFDARARSQNVREALTWTHDLLSSAEREAFRRLAVFAGGFTLEAAQTVLAAFPSVPDETTSAPHMLAGLVAHGLVRQRDATAGSGPARYVMLEAVREFGRERLAVSGETSTARMAHARWYQEFASQAVDGLGEQQQRAWLQRLDTEHPNLRLALDWLASADDIVPALELAADLAWFWRFRGHYAEGRARLEVLLARPVAHENARAWAAAIDGLGLLVRAQGETRRSAELHEQAITVWRTSGPPDRLANSLLLLGLALTSSGDPLARPVLAESLGISRSLAQPRWLSGTLWALGRTLRSRGESMAARDLIEESLQRAQAGDNPSGVAVYLWSLGDVQLDLGELDAALETLQQALGQLWDLGEVWPAVNCLERIASLLARRGDSVAIVLAAAAAAWRERVGLPLPEVDVAALTRDLALLQAGLATSEIAVFQRQGEHLTAAQAVAMALAA